MGSHSWRHDPTPARVVIRRAVVGAAVAGIALGGTLGFLNLPEDVVTAVPAVGAPIVPRSYVNAPPIVPPADPSRTCMPVWWTCGEAFPDTSTTAPRVTTTRASGPTLITGAVPLRSPVAPPAGVVPVVPPAVVPQPVTTALRPLPAPVVTVPPTTTTTTTLPPIFQGTLEVEVP